jgi:hypothetical protein
MSKIKGYRELTEQDIEQINDMKDLEQVLLTCINAMSKVQEFDQRWVSIGRTHIEQGFMALVRAIARPNGE